MNLPEIARMLIDAGADVNIQDENGLTPLHWCAYKNLPEILRMLLDAGADVNIQDEKGKRPYEVARTQEVKKLLKP
jgi:ankyrin repeat protein